MSDTCPKTCKCIQLVNASKEMRAANTAVSPMIEFVDSSNGRTGLRYLAEIVVAKIDNEIRGKPHRVAATYCPFCGKKYPK